MFGKFLLPLVLVQWKDLYLPSPLASLFRAAYAVSGHVVRARFRETLSPGRLSRIHHRNALTEKAWEGVAQGLGNT